MRRLVTVTLGRAASPVLTRSRASISNPEGRGNGRIIALAGVEGAAAAGIAGAAGISRTAAGKALAELETVGAAERTKGDWPRHPGHLAPGPTDPASSAPDAAPAG